MAGPLALLPWLILLLLALGTSSGASQPSSQVFDQTLAVRNLPYSLLADPGAFHASSSDKVLLEAMTDDGVVAVSEIPGFAQLRRDVLVQSRACIDGSAFAAAFEDGTERRTMAASTKGFTEHGALRLGEGDRSSACPGDYIRKVDAFRGLVSLAAAAFTSRLSELLKPSRPFLYDVEHSRPFSTLEQLVAAAEHLEHFHSYRRSSGPDDDAEDGDTIHMHTDMGMFIAFTPGLMVERPPGGTAKASGGGGGRLYVQRRDGSRALADFGHSGDVLVFMLGDGVEQYINPSLESGQLLRAAPHAMVMPRHGPAESRLWYGRMFLPPVSARFEPLGISYGQLHDDAIREIYASGGVGSSIGCSRRQLATEPSDCVGDQIFCWMQCMNFTATANPEVCAAQKLTLQCATKEGKLWDGLAHDKRYNITCAAAALVNSTAPPNSTGTPVSPPPLNTAPPPPPPKGAGSLHPFMDAAILVLILVFQVVAL